MTHGDIVWCDLASADPEAAQTFLAATLDWQFDILTAPDGAPYLLASAAASPVAGLCHSEDRFEGVPLPSGWLPYISVDDLDASLADAVDLGGTALTPPVSYGDGSRIAALSDPEGATFLVIEGSTLPPRPASGPAGTPIWHSLHVTKPANVVAFYEGLFGWQIKRMAGLKRAYRIKSPEGTPIGEMGGKLAKAKTAPAAWLVHVATPRVGKSMRATKKAGGRVIKDDREAARPGQIIAAPDGPLLGLRESNEGATWLTERWRTLLALVCIAGAALAGAPIALLPLFAMWLEVGIRTREIRLVETVARDDAPALYWTIIGVLGALSLALILGPVLG